MFQTFEEQSDKSTGPVRAEKLRSTLSVHNLDGLIIPHDDEYQNEYTPACFERLAWLTGFTGSAGVAVVLSDKAAIFVDGRYTLAVRDQVDTNFFEIVPIMDQSVGDWLSKNAPNDGRIGFDANLHTEASIKRLEKETKDAKLALIATEGNLVDAIWNDRPEEPLAQIVPHPPEYAGKSSQDKRNDVADVIKSKGAQAVVLTNPSSIAWLLNIRGGDVAHTPLPLARGILTDDGHVALFADDRKTSDPLRSHLGNQVTIREITEFEEAVSLLGREQKTILIDPASTPYSIISRLKETDTNIIRGEDPCALPRAMKNEVELDGTRQAHIRDGAALTRFLHWLATDGQSGDVDEITAVKKLESLRAETGALKDISFETISGAGPNGAIVHYRVSERTNRKLERGSLYLVDSGGQYLDGTTDVTRTVSIGTPTDEHRDRFTRVLIGHINLAAARFPEGTTGAELDVLARMALWKAGLNFDHGTGHGVGSYLGVHEGPQSISKRSFNVALKPGMIISNEPGYYKTDEYGIRIENLVVALAPEPIAGGERPMMRFETITLAPIDRTLINPDLLNDDEKTWLNDYHQSVRERISPLLDGDAKTWLVSVTEPF